MARKPNKKKAGKGKKTTPSRHWGLLLGVPALILAFLALCAGADIYVHHPAAWLAEHRSALTAPLEWLGDRTALMTDGLGWTGHDTVYETDDPVPEGQIFFAGAPERRAAPAAADVQPLQRGDFVIGWSASLRRAEWVACHIPQAARFSYDKAPAFQSDRSVANSPTPDAYAKTQFNRAVLAPERALATRFGPDLRRKLRQMTAVVPMPAELEKGPWHETMQRIAELWPAHFGELWVICGCVKGSQTAANVNVPAQYYVLAAAQTKDGVQTLALLFDAATARGAYPTHHIVTINELEQATGYQFFPDMPKFLRTPLKADRPTRLWPVRLADALKLILLRFS